jgi:hypothetical protein
MSIGKTFLIIGIMLAVAAVLLGQPCWFFTMQALVKLAAAALLSTGTV